MAADLHPRVVLEVDGRAVELVDGGGSLLDALRDQLGIHAVKDGCAPQGQCGCCTVLVDGAPRVACVTALRRVAGRRITTVDGFDPAVQAEWAAAFTACGASQCGFCTPGIVARLEGLRARGGDVGDPAEVSQALLAHLCRCTGWRPIFDAAARVAAGRGADPPVGGAGRDLGAAARRAAIEGGTPQRVGPDVTLGQGGFAEDIAPPDALVAVPAPDGGWALGETLAEARTAAARVPGRRSSLAVTWPLEVPPGDWALRLRTTWVDPAYLEPDASWCRPGGVPADPAANGGAFGAKRAGAVQAAARQLADLHGRAVRVVLGREDLVRTGPKRPPVAAGLRADGTGVVRVVRTAGVSARVASVLPDVVVEELDVVGPPTSLDLRGAGWAEAEVLRAALAGTAGVGRAVVRAPAGGWAEVEVGGDGVVHVVVGAGQVLDEVVLRSYCVGAAHMATGWVRSEGLAVGDDGVPADLTLRSAGVLRATEAPVVEVEVVAEDGPPTNGSDAVFAAVAAATWLADGLPPDWPARRR